MIASVWRTLPGSLASVRDILEHISRCHISTSLINPEHVQKTSRFQFCSTAPSTKVFAALASTALGPAQVAIQLNTATRYDHRPSVLWKRSWICLNQLEMGSVNDLFCNLYHLYLEEIRKHRSYWSAARLTWSTQLSACNPFFFIQLPFRSIGPLKLSETVCYCWMMLICWRFGGRKWSTLTMCKIQRCGTSPLL